MTEPVNLGRGGELLFSLSSAESELEGCGWCGEGCVPSGAEGEWLEDLYVELSCAISPLRTVVSSEEVSSGSCVVWLIGTSSRDII